MALDATLALLSKPREVPSEATQGCSIALTGRSVTCTDEVIFQHAHGIYRRPLGETAAGMVKIRLSSGQALATSARHQDCVAYVHPPAQLPSRQTWINNTMSSTASLQFAVWTRCRNKL